MDHRSDKTAAGDISPAAGRSEAPIYQVVVWPHRSLSARGFRILMAGVAAALAFPVIPLIGTPVALGLAPFVVAAWVLLFVFIKRNYRDGRLSETLKVWPDLIHVERREPRGPVKTWEANPYWVELKLHPEQRPENYLTLRGNGRTIELGAFLSPEERLELHAELEDALHKARMAPTAASWKPDGA
ncbi:DUF2244 domain-containing protein [Rhodovulum sp. DZ06]|uniref:DUF2244 domain-containing protein n=1 Tax=Rhodovulum sp. DZ06 TaxID=3425126 RepID=UPI003D32D7A6